MCIRDRPKNRENALRLLRSMLYDKELQHRMAEQAKLILGKKAHNARFIAYFQEITNTYGDGTGLAAYILTLMSMIL